MIGVFEGYILIFTLFFVIAIGWYGKSIVDKMDGGDV